MARNSTSKTGNPSRIRFVMVEAELGDGDIGQITQAIQNALRGPATPVQRIAAPAVIQTITPDAQEVDDKVEVGDGVEMADVTPAAARQPGPRKAAPTPKVIQIDLTSEPSLASFAGRSNPKSNHKRYLVIAAWLHDHRGIDAITADHVYTCYRSLGWPSSIRDFAQPLRELKHKQFFTSPERGKYAINHLGLAQAVKVGAGGGE
jgi:hypothetical protein